MYEIIYTIIRTEAKLSQTGSIVTVASQYHTSLFYLNMSYSYITKLLLTHFTFCLVKWRRHSCGCLLVTHC